MNQQDWLRARAAVTPDALALLYNNEMWHYRQLNELVDQRCWQLQGAGVTSGSHVAVLLGNGDEYVILIHALARLGAVLVPLNTRLTAAEISWQLTQSDATILIYTDAFIGIVSQLANQCMRLNLQSILATPVQNSAPFHAAPFQLDALQAIVFTSGTTGRPKGAMLSFANHFWGANASAYRLGLSPTDRWLSCLPLYHVGGLAVVFRSCLYGTTIVQHARFELSAFSHSLDNDQITLTSVVPTMLHRLLAHRQGKAWPPSLRHILLGGAAATAELLVAAQATGAPVATTYGLTEAASQVATMRPEDVTRKVGSVGKPLMFSNVRIIDSEGLSLPNGQRGEVVVAGPTIMAGYYKNPEATAKTIRNGELYTGDIGYLDDDGDLWLVQRRSELIISGGENIYPAEVEAVLRQHPAVADACVVGLPDAEWGQRVAALIERQPDAIVTTDEILDHCRAQLARYKLPRLVQFTDALPQTASGKIERRAVVEQFLNGNPCQP